ncbi:MAG TPA: hypothetical protein VEZ46_07125 [Mycobacteriales bacterium]|nr:hypothetical protein [Mycobacteriales bacterium]
MTLDAWCGHCGETFRLAQIVEEGAGGRCPRCGFVYNHEYNAVVTTTCTHILTAAQALNDAAQRLADIAPQLHVDRDQLYTALDKHLQR